jgi:hypothetical protein
MIDTIPLCLRDRPVFRGLPVPFTALVKDGVPDFRITDIQRWMQAALNRLCHLCGHSLKKKMWFIGGENCMADRLFFDLGTHFECGMYAFQVCPFLALSTSSYNKRTLQPDDDEMLVRYAQFAETRPEKLGFAATNGYIIGKAPEGMGSYLVHTNPWLEGPFYFANGKEAEAWLKTR